MIGTLLSANAFLKEMLAICDRSDLTIHERFRILRECLDKEVNGPSATGSAKEETPVSPLPSWVRLGQWVENMLCHVDDKEKYSYGQIKSIDLDENLIEVRSIGGSVTPMTLNGLFERYAPIRFRPYTYEETKDLLGKVIEYVDDGERLAQVITRVREVRDEALINLSRFEWLQCSNATIDGMPIGVPEVDTDLLKGEQVND